MKTKSYKPLMTLTEGRDSISSVKVVGAEIFAAGIDGAVRVYDVRMGKVCVDVIGREYTVDPLVEDVCAY